MSDRKRELADEDHSLGAWDAASAQRLLTLEGHKNSVRGCAWSPDGTRLVLTSADGTMKTWDANTGQCLTTILPRLDEQSATLDYAKHEIIWAGKNAWRTLGWTWYDEKNKRLRALPLEHFGWRPE